MILRRVFVAVLLLLILDTAAWVYLCRQVEQGVRETVAAARHNGWSIAAEGMHWGGWPLTAAVELSNVAAAGAVPPGFVWQAGRARVELAFMHPASISIRVDGPQSVQAEGLQPIPLTTASTLIESALDGATPVRARIETLRATLPSGPLTLDRAELSLPANGFIADLAGLALPGVATPIQTSHLRASIDPAMPIAASPETSAQAWRAAGGHIDIADAAIHWDTLDAAGSGKITLDERLQPRAEGSVQASGLPRLLDDLAQTGALAPAQATAAKAVITLLAGGQRVQLPISLEDGVLRLARFPLVRFPPLAWD